jgi:hypothetical protein
MQTVQRTILTHRTGTSVHMRTHNSHLLWRQLLGCFIIHSMRRVRGPGPAGFTSIIPDLWASLTTAIAALLRSQQPPIRCFSTVIGFRYLLTHFSSEIETMRLIHYQCSGMTPKSRELGSQISHSIRPSPMLEVRGFQLGLLGMNPTHYSSP